MGDAGRPSPPEVKALSATERLFVDGIKRAITDGILSVGKASDRLNAKSLQRMVWDLASVKDPKLTKELENEFSPQWCPL